MALVDVDFSISDQGLPKDVATFLREADLRVDQFLKSRSVPISSFVSSDFVTVYHALRAIAKANLAPGSSFCEWGSGFGVVASLASMLEFDVCGIEIERDLVDASQGLADDFGLAVEFVHGSFIPPGAEAEVEEAYAENNNDYFWLATDADAAYDELGLELNDFDLVFAYPWPGEEHLLTELFEKYAAEEALLLLYDQFNSIRLLRKVGESSGIQTV